ncbi:MAG: HAMP domain-containing protein [Gammaproteobacteria bacterium]
MALFAGRPTATPTRPTRPTTTRPEQQWATAVPFGCRAADGQEAVLLNSQRIRIDDAVIGELMAVHLRESSLSWPLATDYQLLMFIPVALLFAGGGGLLIFRLLLRRLRRLEHFAVRLSDGDLDARIPVMGSDEIDHLGERFNRMAIALTEARKLG